MILRAFVANINKVDYKTGLGDWWNSLKGLISLTILQNANKLIITFLYY